MRLRDKYGSEGENGDVYVNNFYVMWDIIENLKVHPMTKMTYDSMWLNSVIKMTSNS